MRNVFFSPTTTTTTERESEPLLSGRKIKSKAVGDTYRYDLNPCRRVCVFSLTKRRERARRVRSDVPGSKGINGTILTNWIPPFDRFFLFERVRGSNEEVENQWHPPKQSPRVYDAHYRRQRRRCTTRMRRYVLCCLLFDDVQIIDTMCKRRMTERYK